MAPFPQRPNQDFEAFYLRHFKAIYRVCFAFLKNAADAEDCTEDVFVKALSCTIAFENERHERSWLTTTAMNLCKDKLKHWWNKSVSSVEESPDLVAPQAEDHNEVLQAVMALPPKHKEVVWLHYYEGYQTDEIATLLGRPPSTVRNQLRDARTKLKTALGGELP